MHRLIERHPPYFKNRRGPQKETGEIGVCRRGFPGQMKQQVGSTKVKRRNRRTPAWQMKLYQCIFTNLLLFVVFFVMISAYHSNCETVVFIRLIEPSLSMREADQAKDYITFFILVLRLVLRTQICASLRKTLKTAVLKVLEYVLH